MKSNIKSFESFNEKVGDIPVKFIKISYYDYNKIAYGMHRGELEDVDYIIDNWDPFTDNEISFIINLFSVFHGGNVDVKINDSFYDESSDSIRKVPRGEIIVSKDREILGGKKPYNDTLCLITKLKDEWYYFSTGWSCFKCDQWEGLLECLRYNQKDLGISF